MDDGVAERPGAVGAGEVRLLRRVSGRPGAEGAPVVGWGAVVVVFEVVVEWVEGGAMRRDWFRC